MRRNRRQVYCHTCSENIEVRFTADVDGLFYACPTCLEMGYSYRTKRMEDERGLGTVSLAGLQSDGLVVKDMGHNGKPISA
jgi:hypothetical protein